MLTVGALSTKDKRLIMLFFYRSIDNMFICRPDNHLSRYQTLRNHSTGRKNIFLILINKVRLKTYLQNCDRGQTFLDLWIPQRWQKIVICYKFREYEPKYFEHCRYSGEPDTFKRTFAEFKRVIFVYLFYLR